jgi:methyl-accepting chemotaxis protein
MKQPRQILPVINSLQYKFFAMSIVYSFIIVCFFFIATFLPDIIEMRNLDLSLEARGSAANRVLKHRWVWPAALALIIVLGLHSFRAFLKVIGPLYRFKWAFEQLEKGNLLSRVRTRKGDYLRQEEESLNNMLEALRGTLRSIKEANDESLKSMDELEKTLNPGSEGDKNQSDLLFAHRGHLEKVAESIRFFRLEEGE